PLAVTDLGGVAWSMVTLYLLYLKVSGLFHLVVGLLHLFGFNLPETNHLYLLASSFTDFWRRVNIYWKDFITKIFFYPMHFRLKRLGPFWAMACATLFAMFCSALLHPYQGFWIRGAWIFNWQDCLFWAVMMTGVLTDALLEAKRGRQRSLSKPQRTVWSEFGRALRTVGMFVTITLLWTLWSRSPEELKALASAATKVTASSVALIVTGLVGLGVAAVLF